MSTNRKKFTIALDRPEEVGNLKEDKVTGDKGKSDYKIEITISREDIFNDFKKVKQRDTEIIKIALASYVYDGARLKPRIQDMDKNNLTGFSLLELPKMNQLKKHLHEAFSLSMWASDEIRFAVDDKETWNKIKRILKVNFPKEFADVDKYETVTQFMESASPIEEIEEKKQDSVAIQEIEPLDYVFTPSNAEVSINAAHALAAGLDPNTVGLRTNGEPFADWMYDRGPGQPFVLSAEINKDRVAKAAIKESKTVDKRNIDMDSVHLNYATMFQKLDEPVPEAGDSKSFTPTSEPKPELKTVVEQPLWCIDLDGCYFKESLNNAIDTFINGNEDEKASYQLEAYEKKKLRQTEDGDYEIHRLDKSKKEYWEKLTIDSATQINDLITDKDVKAICDGLMNTLDIRNQEDWTQLFKKLKENGQPFVFVTRGWHQKIIKEYLARVTGLESKDIIVIAQPLTDGIVNQEGKNRLIKAANKAIGRSENSTNNILIDDDINNLKGSKEYLRGEKFKSIKEDTGAIFEVKQDGTIFADPSDPSCSFLDDACKLSNECAGKAKPVIQEVTGRQPTFTRRTALA